MKPIDSVKTETWIKWTGGLMVTAALFVSYAFAQFETRDHAKEKAVEIQNQLREVNSKLDIILGWRTARMPSGK